MAAGDPALHRAAALAATAPMPGGRGAIEAALVAGLTGDFPQSVLLADIYADPLTAQGFPVRVLPDLGPRELVDPALMSGLVQMVPEDSGSALEFVSVGRLSAVSGAAVTGRTLAEQAAGRGLGPMREASHWAKRRRR